jgi:tetrahydromethanopterin S-methyltransferase subunit G
VEGEDAMPMPMHPQAEINEILNELEQVTRTVEIVRTMVISEMTDGVQKDKIATDFAVIFRSLRGILEDVAEMRNKLSDKY